LKPCACTVRLAKQPAARKVRKVKKVRGFMSFCQRVLSIIGIQL
jgi:hypothetical protein